MTVDVDQVVPRYLGVRTGEPGGTGPAGDPAAHDRVRRHIEVAGRREPGTTTVEVTSTASGNLEIVIVADDMPLLVEAVLATVESWALTVDGIDHPVMPVVRDDAGVLTEVGEGPSAISESWIYVRALAAKTGIDASGFRDGLIPVIARVADVHRDFEQTRTTLTDCADGFANAPIDAAERDEYVRLLKWFAGPQLTLLGHEFAPAGAEGVGDRLGVWRADGIAAPGHAAASRTPVISRVYLRTGIQRSAYPVLLQVPVFTPDGAPAGEHRFLGNFTTWGRHQSILDIPVIGPKVDDVLSVAGVDADSYAGQSIIELLQNYPLVELFWLSAADLARRSEEMLDAVDSRSLRWFVRATPGARTASVLVYLPRDRYTTASRLSLQDEIATRLQATDLEYTARVSELPLALLQLLVRVDDEAIAGLGSLEPGSTAHAEIQQALRDRIRSWDDRVREAAPAAVAELLRVPSATLGADDGADTLLALVSALSEDYKESRTPEDAVVDLAHVVGLEPGGMTVTMRRCAADSARWTFTLYLCGKSVSLTDVLPVLQSLGVAVLDEHPYGLDRHDGVRCWAYEFGVSLAPGITIDPDSDEAGLTLRFTDAFRALWQGEAEVDAFNALIVRCGLDWRAVAILRACYRYLRQIGFGYSTAHSATVLGDERAVTLGLVSVFEASFDPAMADDGRRGDAVAGLRRDIGAVIGLDADRIVSAFAATMLAVVRTNVYVTDRLVPGAVMSFKLDTQNIPQAPEPRPVHEIFVYSPRVEGVHLRFGAVARGGLRWSDRREDFRTEILGLVKAQSVKNAVIVPLGAKGGFVLKRPPVPTGDAAADRDALREEGVKCYRQFISGLLDVTDNIDTATGAVVPARSVVRRDGDDTYLVVAADKGTAAFSDIANGVAAQYGFWLGDAFASGGSAGYDHKAMGITARGAWESVKRHFREIGIDTQTQDFTVVGVGDMSGDVFGNGMLLSGHIRLVAAFDHRHIFVDPNPDAAQSFIERKRLFDLPRSSWAEYDLALIGEGGGVWPRDQKAIPISPQMATALGIDPAVDVLSPPELMRAILLAPVDLLWNGGIGTYIKASTESNPEVGDKANDSIRVDGNEVRATVVGEGGNLGVTELGRIEFDLAGGRINTDAMDNSAGVDCSDHEVNIKVLLDTAVGSGKLPAGQRDSLLSSMTDEVAELVLADNIAQNAELGFSRAYALERVEVHARMLASLAERGVDLRLESLPTAAALRKRVHGETGRALTSPELATMMAHVKLLAKSDLLAGDLVDNDVFDDRLARYFPEPLRSAYADELRTHRLRREIVATTLVNEVVAHVGVTHLFRLTEGAAVGAEDGVRAFVVVNKVFGMREVFDSISAAPVDVKTVDEMLRYTRRLMFRASRWLLAGRPQPLAGASEITRYATRVAQLSPLLPGWFGASSARDVDERTAAYRDAGVPEEIAHQAAISLHRFCLLDIIDAAEISEKPVAEVGALYFAVMEHFGIERLLTAVSELDHGDRWHALARLALRDDMHATLRAVTQQVLEHGAPGESPADMINEWSHSQSSRLARVRSMLVEIEESGTLDLATLSVATRQLRSLLR
ncbi:NAD-glutamate dehydrogenase [Gordonia sp. (in: high G+C Gram-positive bacteria)]|uniref:NAD-glutamate dehydrogenase n=1 Tax=Gordonia sp. (in: high G+C Gram-positive bacteria) TaxID=84139 RepID=UPI002BD7E75E|nr:NAD-glutamate dehydrogenase [Gordonia sp. (in: high G+C Gram-positive bacteria)]HMS73769.1 NAD-glutamate dehydrogenase [Gordonia sp. (in: high G+C Gram-positive bacteria)]